MVVFDVMDIHNKHQGSRRVADKEGLKEQKDQATLYVGETARSVSGRAGEHWEDALGGKEESHMLEHLAAATEMRVSPSSSSE
jgi:hypothetical protein